MAFLQSELPSSTVPVAPRRNDPRAKWSGQGRDHLRSYIRVLAGVLAAVLLLVLGVTAGRATESLAIGIISADLVFLLVVALWSAFAGQPRR